MKNIIFEIIEKINEFDMFLIFDHIESKYYFIMGLCICFILYLIFIGNRSFRDRIIRSGNYKQFIWLVFVIVIIYFFVLFIMYCLEITPHWENRSFNLMGFSLSYPQNIPKNHLFFIAIIILFISTIFFNGLFVSTITNMYKSCGDQFEKGLKIYPCKDHYIFLGYNRIIIGLINKFESSKKKKSKCCSLCSAVMNPFKKYGYVIISTKPASEIRMELRNHLDQSVFDKILIVQNQMYCSKQYKKLDIDKAKKIFILGEIPDDEYSDSINIRCYQEIAKYFKRNNINKIPEIHLMIKYPNAVYPLLEYLYQQENMVDFIPFNIYEMWARQVFVGKLIEEESSKNDENNIQYKKLDYGNICYDEEKFVHLIVVGMSRMGIAMAIQAIRIGHYANFEKKKTRITFIDDNMDIRKDIFASRYYEFYKAVDIIQEEQPTQKGFTDIELEFINGRIESPEIRSLLVSWAQNPDDITTVAICVNNPTDSMSIAFRLPSELYDFNNKIPILYYQKNAFNIFNAFNQGNNDSRFSNVLPFGTVENCSNNFDLNNNISEEAVERFMENNSSKSTSDSSKRKGNLLCRWISQYLIDHIPTKKQIKKYNEEKVKKILNRWSSQYLIDHIPTKKQIKKYNEKKDNLIEILASVEHNRWVVERLLLGFSPVADENIKKEIKAIQDKLETEQSEDNIKILEDEFKTIKGKNEKNYQHHCLCQYCDLHQSDKDKNIEIAKQYENILEKYKECLKKHL